MWLFMQEKILIKDQHIFFLFVFSFKTYARTRVVTWFSTKAYGIDRRLAERDAGEDALGLFELNVEYSTATHYSA